jgi:aspartyl-tRNA(Asn)/glutamyl-tRNA(Gln) amidotransferase subunit A
MNKGLGESSPHLLSPPAGALPYRGVRDFRNAHISGNSSVCETLKKIFAEARTVDARTAGVTALFTDQALLRGAELDALRVRHSSQQGLAADGEFAQRYPLFGVPVFVKENISVKHAPLRCASRILEGYVCPYDATVIKRLEAAGGVIVGYTNMDEFAMGSSTEHSCHGPSYNPYDQTRVPGGSSGGGAIVTALGLSPISLGSDTGGSVRQPAAFCNVYGFKPTYGSISRYGLVAFGSSLDQISPFARTVDDLIQACAVLAGRDALDATSRLADPEFAGLLRSQDSELPKKSRIGIPWDLVRSISTQEVLSGFETFVAGLKADGHSVVDVELSALGIVLPAYYVISSAEASSNLSRFDGLKYGLRLDGKTREEVVKVTRSRCFGNEVKRRICLGTFVLSSGYYDAYYGKAMRMRRFLAEEYAKVFRDVDFVLTPTTPTSAFAIGENMSDPVQMYAGDVLTIPPSLAGLPALSVPIPGFSKRPAGAQIVGALGADAKLLRFAKQAENAGLCGISELRSGGIQ